ncbi:LysR family transcriptional regulator [Actinophytocola algeriensis]|uniref:DNA-binding transcriptional LysR family regulator n=1 Tax=Actinophytocola algeriensis TaxID=1768010 RepID=A0A7W7QAC0_9PSEU|nr:LysR family transcriptional regulator [Actinophytocola algeriensis]MBB4909788.1 DNA-binding transcriptional LysR family regulator [Actinophytocola algeriensis]MBE1475778.1 DNA-binding transcriptional LysR family regulator [Actinophytocola algeriensis]
MDVRQLQYFLAIVDHGSVHRAAQELFVAQPSVSQALRALERDLGTDLFHRTGRRLVLTPAGERLIDPAREVLRGVELARATVEAVHGLRSGRLVIASMPSQAVSPLAPMISRFRAEYPLVEVSVRAAATPPEVIAAVRAGSAELGVLGAPSLGPELAGLTVHQLETQAFVLVAATEADLPAAGAPVSSDALAGQRLIVGQPGTGMRRVADEILRRSRGSRIAVEIEHREAVLPLVLARVGVAVLSESWRELARSAGAVVRDLAGDEVLRVCLVHRDGRLSPAAAAFLPG